MADGDCDSYSLPMSRTRSAFGAVPVVVEEADPREYPVDLGELFPEERAHVRAAVPKRVREFIAGRSLARLALTRLGVEACPIPAGDDRAPVWPHDVLGSISHTDDWCVVAVAWSRDIGFLGVDVERDTPLARELWDTVCRPEELRWLERAPPSDRGRLAKVVFSAKEAAYKALYPVIGRILDFDAMAVEIDVARARWQATLRPEHRSPTCPWEVLGGLVRDRGLVITTVAMST